jgi:O-Antigen ligase
MSPGGKRSWTDPPQAPEGSRPIARGLLIAFAVLLPFEKPIGSLGPLTITTVEAALYALLGGWAIGIVADARRLNPGGGTLAALRAKVLWSTREPVARAVLLWLTVVMVSALLAPEHRTWAVKVAFRALGGGLLFFAARDLVRSATEIRRVAIAIVIGAVLSAAGAVVEIVVPSTEILWHSFRTATFSVTGLPRPSGPLGYPTIAAMYWEAALPLAVTLALIPRESRRNRRWPGVALAIASAGVLIAATLFSATRTALAVVALSSVALVVLTWRGERAIRVATCGALGLVVLLAGTTLASTGGESALAMRLRWWQDGSWYRAKYGVADDNLTMTAGSLVRVAVTVQNTGALMWPHTGRNSVQLAYHWESKDARGTHLDFEGRRSPLPGDVAPDAMARVIAIVQAPDEPGRYRLRWDLVRENVIWFSAGGTVTRDQTVDVVTPAPGTRTHARRDSTLLDSTLEDLVSSTVPTRPVLWRAAIGLWRRHPLLGVGPDNFRHLYPQVIVPRSANPIVPYDQRTHANSLYFETLADLGLAGMLALGLLVAAIATTAATARRRLAGVWIPLSAACAIALGTFFLHGLLDYFLTFTPTYGLYWLLIALVASAAGAASGAGEQAKRVASPM